MNREDWKERKTRLVVEVDSNKARKLHNELLDRKDEVKCIAAIDGPMMYEHKAELRFKDENDESKVYEVLIDYFRHSYETLVKINVYQFGDDVTAKINVRGPLDKANMIECLLDTLYSDYSVDGVEVPEHVSEVTL